MKKSDEIAVVKADIRRLKRRWSYCYNQYCEHGADQRVLYGLDDAIATLEKYLAKIERTK